MGYPPWPGKRRMRVIIKERLGRAIANIDWSVKFPNATVFYLPKILSNHHPLLIDLYNNHYPSHSKPFPFKHIWMQHNDFNNLILQTWDTNNPIQAP